MLNKVLESCKTALKTIRNKRTGSCILKLFTLEVSSQNLKDYSVNRHFFI